MPHKIPWHERPDEINCVINPPFCGDRLTELLNYIYFLVSLFLVGRCSNRVTCQFYLLRHEVYDL